MITCKKIAIIFLWLSITSCYNSTHHQERIIASVNGEPITCPEFEARIAENRANVIKYYRQNYGLEYSADFWNTRILDQTPSDFLKQRVLDALIEYKMKQIIAKEYGILEDLSYACFLEKLNTENQQRNEALNKKKVIYGPVNYSESIFYHYQLANLDIELQKLIVDQKPVLEVELRQFYETYKDSLFNLGSLPETYLFSMTTDNKRKGKPQEEKTNSEESVLQLIQKKLLSGVTVNEVMNYSYGTGVKINCQKLNRNGENFDLEEENRIEIDLKNLSIKLQAGEVSGIFKTNDLPAFLYVARQGEKRFLPYNELRPVILDRMNRMKYNQAIKKRLKNAEVFVYDDILESVIIN